jgi:hypothetical protein
MTSKKPKRTLKSSGSRDPENKTKDGRKQTAESSKSHIFLFSLPTAYRLLPSIIEVTAEISLADRLPGFFHTFRAKGDFALDGVKKDVPA